MRLARGDNFRLEFSCGLALRHANLLFIAQLFTDRLFTKQMFTPQRDGPLCVDPSGRPAFIYYACIQVF